MSDKMPSCMRAPPDAANMMKGVPLLTAGSMPLICARPPRHPERPAHELEILHADHDRLPFEAPETELDRIVESGLGARIFDAIGVAALVAEFQRIDRDFGDRNVEPRLVVEHRLEAR